MAALDHLEALLADFLSARSLGRDEVFSRLSKSLREAISDGFHNEVATVLARAVLPTLDYTSLRSLSDLYASIRQEGMLGPPQAKLVVMGNVATEQLIPLLELFLYGGGVVTEVNQSSFGVFRQEILDPRSELHVHQPSIVLLLTQWRDLSHCPLLCNEGQKIGKFVEAELADWVGLWERLYQDFRCQIVQDNFALPPWRALGNHEMRHPSSLGRFIAEVNQRLQEKAFPYVTIHDIDHVAASVGRWRWFDPRFYHHAKLPCAPECIPTYAHSLASIVLTLLGASKKCLVLDLDNTLWGGNAGDDGLQGIVLGPGSGEAEAFQAFQRYIKSLQQRGVILAVCSKNEPRFAEEVFDRHPGMILRREDVSCFIANWNDKPANIRVIAETLNIGLDSMVFVDDDPSERALVRRFLPKVAVPELPEDISGYIQAIDTHRYFQVTSLGEEDFRRTEYYRTNVRREVAKTTTRSLADFLKSLQMTADVEPINEQNLQRCVQLINKSNQFNLTGRRHSAGWLTTAATDESWITLAVSLADRFGDNGLVSVVLAEVKANELRIDTWVMSCRVLQRGLEAFVLNYLHHLACQRNMSWITGEYVPTDRNALVRDHYARLCFEPVDQTGSDRTRWRLAVTEDWSGTETFITESIRNE